MKQISQEEFEKCIESLINREISKVKLAKLLESDVRTLDVKIQELVVTNPKLYEEYVHTLPYKQKGYNHIDYEALLIYALKKELTLEQVAQEFDISRRTLSRRINDLGDIKVVRLYRAVAQNRKRGVQDSLEIVKEIEELQERTVILDDVNARREEELLQIEKRFNELCMTMSKKQAAQVMGYNDRDRIYKLLNELYKLKIEKRERESHEKKFRNSIKYIPSDRKISIDSVNTNNKLELQQKDCKERG